MQEDLIFSSIKNGHKNSKTQTNGHVKEIDEELDVENYEDEDEDEEDELETPPLPSGGGMGAGVFSTLTSGPSLVESDASVKELFSNQNLLMKTDLSGPAIPIMARLFTLSYKYRAKEMQRFLWTYLKLRVSKDRKGRDDIVALALRRQGLRDEDDL